MKSEIAALIDALNIKGAAANDFREYLKNNIPARTRLINIIESHALLQYQEFLNQDKKTASVALTSYATK